jgi:hypothetical protein
MIRICTVLLFPALIATYQACGRGTQYSIDKSSPNGTYRIKIEVTAGSNAFQRLGDHCKVQYFKGQQEIGGYETSCRQDEYEFSLAEGLQVVEWSADNVARIGRDRSNQPFADELLVSNTTGEDIKYLGIGYGRFQNFVIFDLPAKGKLTIPASPEFKPDGTSNYYVSFAGNTEKGVVEGVVRQKQRRSPKDGPLRFEITIDSNSYRK